MLIEIIIAIIILGGIFLMAAMMFLIIMFCCVGSITSVQGANYGPYYDDDCFAEEYERYATKGYGSSRDPPRDN